LHHISAPTSIEALAVAASLLSVWLTIHRRISCWPVGLVGGAAYFARFVRDRLYADAALQVIYFAQGVYGWYSWHDDERQAAPPIRTLSTRWLLTFMVGLAAVAWGTGSLLARYTDAVAPHWDAAASATSLTANQLLTRRCIENWVLWIAVDVVYVGLFLWKGLYLSAALYGLFFIMAAAGLRRWVHEQRAQLTLPDLAPEAAAV
jgi:nicotinamide mononucleotide transporter